MSILISYLGPYLLIGLCFALWHRPADVVRVKRSQALRMLLNDSARGGWLWLEVLIYMILRALFWPLHLILHED